MNISGLSSNFYLSDNPIFLVISDINPLTSYIEIFITKYDSQGFTESVSKPQKIYNLSSTVNIDIAPLVKSFMPEPNHNTDYSNLSNIPFYNNSIKAMVSISEVGTTTNTITATKYFIRGGKRTYLSNQNLTAGTNLIPSDTIPVWAGFPVDYYFTSATYGMEKTNIISAALKEDRTIKGCNPIYVKFMNSLGGYSYWLFENWETEESNNNQGSILRQSDILDLGSDFESGITLISKVPARFVPIIKDLIISKEIYLYTPEDQTWQRISSENNKVSTNPYSVNNKVKLKFKPYTRFNTALLW